MMLDLDQLIQRYQLKITGIVHCGAHLAEEAAAYQRMGITKVWWIEANPAVLPRIEAELKPYPEQRLIHALLYSEDDVELDFNVTNYDGMSSSILEFGTHPTFSPDTVFVDKLTLSTKTIDTLVTENEIESCNVLSMDLQGAELECLKGATQFLETTEYVYSEVNNAEVYIGCAQVEQLDEFLDGFKRVETVWVGNQGWGDALWVRV